MIRTEKEKTCGLEDTAYKVFEMQRQPAQTREQSIRGQQHMVTQRAAVQLGTPKASCLSLISVSVRGEGCGGGGVVGVSVCLSVPPALHLILLFKQ